MTTDLEALHLKADLVARGLSVDPARNGAPPHDVVDLVLPTNLRVAAPVRIDAQPAASYRLVDEDDRTFLEANDGREPSTRIPVQMARRPQFYGDRTTTGRLMSEIGLVRGQAVVITPGGACGYSLRGAPCAFCVEGGREVQTGTSVVPPADVMEVVRTARREGAVRVVLLNTASFDREDGGLAFLAPYIEAIRRHVDTLIAVQMHPPRDTRWVDHAYALGVDALSYNLEFFDPEACNRHCSGRARFIGRERYLDMLAHAARVFPRGAVWSELVTGIESPDATMAGIDALARLGVLPVISVPRATGASSAAPDASRDRLTAVLRHLGATVGTRQTNAGWIPELSLAITPLEARRASEQPPGSALALQAWIARSRLGGVVTRGLSRVRRRLRVHRTRDSASSAH